VREGGNLTVGIWQEPEGMLSAGITDDMIQATALIGPAVEGLLTLKPLSRVPKGARPADYWAPQLATQVPTVENGGVKVTNGKMTVTWKLRHGVTWHDGEPFTSRDVKDTFDFWWLKYRAANPTPIISTAGWDQVTSVDVPDDYTAIVHFGSVYGGYLSLATLASGGILPGHLLEQAWEQGGDLTRVKLKIALAGGYSGSDTWDRWLVGTGPFIFKQWAPQDHVTLVRNPRYWGPRAHLDQITVKFEPGVDAELGDLRTGAIDMGLDFQPALLSPLEHLSGVKTEVLPDSGAEKIDLNLHNRYLADANVRKAILMGIDRQKLVDTLLEGRSVVPADSIICLGEAAWCSDSSVPRTRYDPVAANKLLDQAGYKLNQATKIRNFSDGSPIALTLITPSGSAIRVQQQASIAADLRAIGIDVKVPGQGGPPNPAISQLSASFAAGGILLNHTFDMAMYTSVVVGGEPDGWYPAYVCDQIPSQSNGGSGDNTTQVCDTGLDAAFRKGRTAVGQAERKSDYVEAQKIVAEIVPEIPLYQQVTVHAYSSKLVGHDGNPDFWLANTEKLGFVS
jgi:peptide/nickel transport system substrate-binding protein